MSLDSEACKRFLKPWEYDNELGVLEVSPDEIKVGHHLGSGNKSSTRKATWKGQTVALKSWYDYTCCKAYSQWELSRYFDLKAVQGILVPKLYFVSRKRNESMRMLGLELGEPVSGNESGLEEAKDNLEAALRKVGWRQRSGSFRDDNLVWMRNENGSKRLVAIDLESFIPYFGSEVEAPVVRNGITFFGLPEISPAELCLTAHCDPTWEWTTNGRRRDSKWQEEEVTILAFNSWEHCDLVSDLGRYNALEKQQGLLIPRPLFVARERNGCILLGFQRYRCIYQCNPDDKARDGLKKALLQLGWDLSTCSRMAWLGEGESKRLVVVVDLHELKQVEPVPDAVPTDDSTDESSTASPVSKRRMCYLSVQGEEATEGDQVESSLRL